MSSPSVMPNSISRTLLVFLITIRASQIKNMYGVLRKWPTCKSHVSHEDVDPFQHPSCLVSNTALPPSPNSNSKRLILSRRRINLHLCRIPQLSMSSLITATFTQPLQWLSWASGWQLQIFFIYRQLQCSWRVGLTSMSVPPIGAIRGVETTNIWDLVETLSNRLITFLKSSPMLWPWRFLPVPHSNSKLNWAKERNLQLSSQLLTTTPCIVVGQEYSWLWL